MNRVLLGLGVIVSALAGGSAWAVPTVYDGFDYVGGSPLAGQNGGYGWSGPWVEVGGGEGDDFTVSPDGSSPAFPNLPFTPIGNFGVATGPGGTANSNFVRRSLIAPINMAEEQTFYASVLMHKAGASSGSVNNFEFNLTSGTAQAIRTGATSSNQLFLGVSGNTAPEFSFTTGEAAETYMLVLKVETNVDENNNNLYSVAIFDSSETIPLAEPTEYTLDFTTSPTSANRNATLDTVQFAIGNRAQGYFDEVRIGRTWEDVTSFNPNYIPGDFDFSGGIGPSDYEILAANLYTGTSYEQGDLNLNGQVDLEDFAIFREIYTSAGLVLPLGGPGAAVPEPATWLTLAGVAMAAPLWLRRRKVS